MKGTTKSTKAHEISVTNHQSKLAIDRRVIVRAVRGVLTEAAVQKACISVVVVDDPTIHDLNRRFLAHDYPTDVLSFPLSTDSENLDGEIVVSADTASQSASQFGWSAAEELLLYIIHGTLHLVGYDDHTPRQRAKMRAQERAHLEQLKNK